MWLRHSLLILGSLGSSSHSKIQNQVICARANQAKVRKSTVPLTFTDCMMDMHEETVQDNLTSCHVLASTSYIKCQTVIILIARVVHWHLCKTFIVFICHQTPEPLSVLCRILLIWYSGILDCSPTSGQHLDIE